MVASRLYDVKTSKTLASWAHATFYIKKRIKKTHKRVPKSAANSNKPHFLVNFKIAANMAAFFIASCPI